MIRDYRKPLIVVGPKLLLRHPAAVSSLAEMIPGTKFLPVLDDNEVINPLSVKRLCFISGKLFYDLSKQIRGEPERQKYAFVRVEELCPFPKHQIAQVVEKYASVEGNYD